MELKHTEVLRPRHVLYLGFIDRGLVVSICTGAEFNRLHAKTQIMEIHVTL